MRRSAFRSVLAGLAVLLAFAWMQPAHAVVASSLSGTGSGTISGPLGPNPSTLTMTLSATLAGMTTNGSSGGSSIGTVYCSLAGSGAGSVLSSAGSGNGTCVGGTVTAPIRATCSFTWTRTGDVFQLSVTCTFTINSTSFTAGGSGDFMWTPTSFPVSSYVLSGSLDQTDVTQ